MDSEFGVKYQPCGPDPTFGPFRISRSIFYSIHAKFNDILYIELFFLFREWHSCQWRKNGSSIADWCRVGGSELSQPIIITIFAVPNKGQLLVNFADVAMRFPS